MFGPADPASTGTVFATGLPQTNRSGCAIQARSSSCGRTATRETPPRVDLRAREVRVRLVVVAVGVLVFPLIHFGLTASGSGSKKPANVELRRARSASSMRRAASRYWVVSLCDLKLRRAAISFARFS